MIRYDTMPTHELQCTHLPPTLLYLVLEHLALRSA